MLETNSGSLDVKLHTCWGHTARTKTSHSINTARATDFAEDNTDYVKLLLYFLAVN